MVGFAFFDYRILKNNSSVIIILYLLALFFLGVVIFLGKHISGIKWLQLSSFGFDPLEFAKIVIVLLLAKYFSLRHIELYKKRHLIVSFIYVALPIFLVLLQPDLGSALIFIAAWLGLVLVSGIKLRHLVVIILLAAIIFGIMWLGFLKDYQKNRILTFLNPQKDPLGYSYNLRQSLIAIGSGKIFGKGFGKGLQSQLKFLPAGHTDFIFSVFAEERGFAGILFLFLLYAVLIYRILAIGFAASDNFSKLFSMGFSIMIFAQILINIGMCLGLMPVIGIPLPFASYGGSSLLANFLGLGIIQSIRVRN